MIELNQYKNTRWSKDETISFMGSSCLGVDLDWSNHQAGDCQPVYGLRIHVDWRMAAVSSYPEHAAFLRWSISFAVVQSNCYWSWLIWSFFFFIGEVIASIKSSGKKPPLLSESSWSDPFRGFLCYLGAASQSGNFCPGIYSFLYRSVSYTASSKLC